MQLSKPAEILAYIGLGSNLSNPEEQVLHARESIASTQNIKEVAFSSLYQSSPMGPQDQPDYINAVMSVVTDLPPLSLLQALQTIENNQGRVRLERWGARTLDLDLLLYADQKIDLPELKVPHAGMTERAFVLYPLHELAPDLTIPGIGSLAALLAQCPPTGLTRLPS